jgi:hypothetical protein
MSELSFAVDGASPVAFAVSPQIALSLRVTNARPERPVESVLLRCQVQIDASARSYGPEETRGLRDLFGSGATWGRSMTRLSWTHTAVVVPPFTHEANVDVIVPCTFDMCVATAKYFRALLEGGAPIILLFGGTIFRRDDGGALQAAPISWSTEARFTIPGRVWRDAVAHHYAGIMPLPLRQDVFDRLDRYRRENSLPTWEQVIDRLLPGASRAGGGPS